MTSIRIRQNRLNPPEIRLNSFVTDVAIIFKVLSTDTRYVTSSSFAIALRWSQHWFRWWHSAITLTNIDSYLCRNMTSLSNNEFNWNLAKSRPPIPVCIRFSDVFAKLGTSEILVQEGLQTGYAYRYVVCKWYISYHIYSSALGTLSLTEISLTSAEFRACICNHNYKNQ